MINDFQIGADPEFIMADTNGVLHPWPDGGHEMVTPEGNIGPDHGGLVAELRPTPSLNTYSFVKNIKAMLNNPDWGSNHNYRWLAGPLQTVDIRICDCCCQIHCTCDDEDVNFETENQPLGGHIHLDIRANETRWDSVVDALDVQYRFLENLEIFPKEACAHRRREGYGDYRQVTCNSLEDDRTDKEYIDEYLSPEEAETYHMEFRTPPSWLYHPRIAMLALTSAKLAAADPQGTIEALSGKPIRMNTLRAWYERYKFKDINVERVADRILKGTRIQQLQFDTNKDFKKAWETLDF